MKKTAPLLALALILVLTPLASRRAHAQPADTVQSVIDKHLAAMGGRDAIAKITTRHSTGMIALSTPVGELSGPVELFLKAPNRSRAVMTLDLTALGASGNLTVEQIFDGTEAWSINPMQGDQPITGVQLENMKYSSFPSFFLTKTFDGNTLELQPRETIAGKAWIVMKITRPSGAFATAYFDPATYLVGRTVSLVENPNGGTIQQSSEQSDYRTVDGIKVPFSIVNSSEIQTVTIKLTKVEQNVTVDDGMFHKK
jgi:hypothetical protein